MSEEDNLNNNIQASDNSVALGSVSIGGSIDGSLIIGSNNVVGFTSDQISALIYISSKVFDRYCAYMGPDVFGAEVQVVL